MDNFIETIENYSVHRHNNKVRFIEDVSTKIMMAHFMEGPDLDEAAKKCVDMATALYNALHPNEELEGE